MYRPVAFAEDRPETLWQAIAEIRLATLVTPHAGGIEVTHVPMVRRGDVLETHVARANPHWRMLAAGAPSVAIFQGPQAYVSPAFYPSKAETGKVVPTWAYIAVHVHGHLRAVQEPDWLRAHLGRLTDHTEAEQPAPWTVEDTPEDYLRGLMRGIVGLELVPERIEGAWKINQHKTEADRRGTAEGLAASGEQGVALAAHLRATL